MQLRTYAWMRARLIFNTNFNDALTKREILKKWSSIIQPIDFKTVVRYIPLTGHICAHSHVGTT